MTANIPPPTILLINSSTEDAHRIETILASGAVSLITVPTAMDGVALAQQLRPALIMLDVCEPGFDGTAVCQQLLAHPTTQEIPVLFIVPLAAPLEDKTALLAHGEDYVNKPFQPAELLARITPRLRSRQLQQTLNQSEARFISLVEGSIQGILIHRATKPLLVNTAYARILGYDSPAEILAMPSVVSMIAPHERERLLSYHAARLQGQSAPHHYEYDAVCKDGSLVTLQQIVTTFPWDGETAVMATVIDITEHKVAEKALHESEERYRTVIAAMSEGLVLHQASGEIIFANAAAESALGLSLDQMTGRTPMDPTWRAIHEDGSPFPGDTHPASVTLRTGQPQYNVIMGVHKPDGSVSWISINSQALIQPGEENRYAVIATFHDITEHKRAEQFIQENEARYRILFEQANDAIFLTDEDDRILDVNQRACEMLGYSRDELLAMTVPDLQAPEVRGALGQVMKTELSLFKGMPFESVDMRRDGTRIPVEVSTSLLVDSKDGRLALSIVRDITKRKQVERALQESEARLNGIINSAMDAIIVIDEAQTIVLFNPTAERVFAYKANEVLGRPLSILLPERYSPSHIEHIHSFRKTGVTNRQMGTGMVYGVRANGTEFPLEASISQLSVNDRHFYTAILRDITQRKELEEKFYQAQKLEVIGLLAGGIAHDFNNLLTPIMMYSNLGMLTRKSGDPSHEYFDIIKETAERAKQLTQQILALSRKQVLAIEAVQLNEAVTNYAKVMERVIGENIALQITLHENLPLIQADKGQLGQVLMNLIINARDAMPNGGVLKVATAVAQIHTMMPGNPETVLPGSYVVLSVQDAGYGIGKEIAPHLFEPFFTTKGIDQGTGLGLATVLSIVKRHQGFIQFHSRPGKGTTFRVYLPYSPDIQLMPEVESSSPPHEVVTGTGAILIVEDEQAVRLPLVHALQLQGYQVLEAVNGEEALQIATNYPGTLKLIITDMVMPGMNGYELRQKLMELSPSIKVLFMSGYSGDTVERITLNKDVDLLQKPFSLQQFTQKINAILSA